MINKPWVTPSRSLAIALITLAAAGCARPTATPPPTATAAPSYTPRPTRTPSATLTPDATPTPQQTATPTPWPTPWPPSEPLPVVMTLDEAEQTVLDWAIPEREARIERSAFVSTEDFLAIYRREEDWPLLADTAVGMLYLLNKGMTPPSGWWIVVEGSQRGMDLLGFSHPRGSRGNSTPANLCEPAASDTRFTFTAFFDPATGQYLGYNAADMTMTGIPESVWQAAQARSRPVRASTPSPTPTPVPSPTLTPASIVSPPRTPKPTPTVPFAVDATVVPLAAGEVPQAVVDTARVLPWVSGARWTYRRTGVFNGVRWSVDTVTETVASALRMSASTMQVELGRENAERWNLWADGTGARHYMRPEGLFADFGPEPGNPSAIFRLPLQPATEVGYFWYVDRIESITVPAGRFENCYVLVENAGAANLWAHWLCPGVGFVRHELPAFSADDGGYVVLELTDYHIPPIVPVP